MGPWRRRSGVIWRRRFRGATYVPWAPPTRYTHDAINDGGDDAPMGPRDVRLWRGIFVGIIVLVAFIAVVALVTE